MNDTNEYDLYSKRSNFENATLLKKNNELEN